MGNCISCRKCCKCQTSYNVDDNAVELIPAPQPLIDDKLPKPIDIVPLPKPPSDSSDADEDTFKVQSVDILVSQNGKAHYTYDYELMERSENAELVVRRGQPFQLLLNCNRDYQPANDAVSLVFTVADSKQPSPSNGTLIALPLLEEEEPPAGWSTKIIQKGHHCLLIQITTLATAIVGAWKMDIDTKSTSTSEALCYTLPQPIYILFNPWCKEDQVYLEDESCKKEYIMADSGLIWRGSHKQMRPCPWHFAQFEKNILQCSLYLLNQVGKLSVAGRADPVRVARVISAAVNSTDDRGVLEGNWSGDYTGGKEPTKWQGSMLILQEYWNTKKPVKYGQCWVFSGVTTSVCRALGIPARSVTNFSSAHDTQGSLTIDTFVGDDGKVLEEMNSDSIWNFHVWNEVWMQRPDLEPGDYGGWQAIDATPQEESDGIYRCGPTSVAAVKRGEVRKQFDTGFQFAEVNADKVYWKYKGSNQPLKLMDKRTNEIGLNLSTKAVGKFERQDITSEYKHRENTPEERDVMLKALRQCENIFSRFYLNENFEDIKFDFQLRDDIVIGSPFNVAVKISNKSCNTEYNVSVTLRVDTVLYTGKIKNLVKKQQFSTTVAAGRVDELIMPVSYSEYAPELADQCAFNIACLANVKETDFEYFAQDDFRCRKPDIVVKAPQHVIASQEFEVQVSLKNPLPDTLNRAKFLIEGVGLGSPCKIVLPGPVEPGEVAQASAKLTASKSGEKTISAKFYSKEMNDVDGYLVIQVREKVNELMGSFPSLAEDSDDDGDAVEE